MRSGKERHIAKVRGLLALMVRETEELTLEALGRYLGRDANGLSRQAARLTSKSLRARAEITSAFLLTHHLHLLCCKFLKTNKLSANLRLASEALSHQKCGSYFCTSPKFARTFFRDRPNSRALN